MHGAAPDSSKRHGRHALPPVRPEEADEALPLSDDALLDLDWLDEEEPQPELRDFWLEDEEERED